MYLWVSHTWDPFKPHRCAHLCTYCYALKTHHRFHLPVLLKPVLAEPFPHLYWLDGRGRTIFVGHMSDMWADNVSDAQIYKTLTWCYHYENNQYVFQSKNPQRFMDFIEVLNPGNTILGTTIETDAYEGVSNAPGPALRSEALKEMGREGFTTFVTIEPILEFRLIPFVALLRNAKPDFINIGADSKGSGLNEPCGEKIGTLIKEICELGIEIRVKPNLERLMGIKEKVELSLRYKDY